MTSTIDPSKSPIVTGMPAQKKKAPAISTATGSGNGPQVFNMTEGNADPSRKGVVLEREGEKGVAGVLNLNGKKQMYTGDPQLLKLLDEYHSYLTGDKSYGKAGLGARFGVIGIYARRTPPPVLFDDPDLVSLLGDTMCVDMVGRVFVYAPFFLARLQEDQKRELSVIPCLSHEYSHSFLEHNYRMRALDSTIANIAQDRAINPMQVQMWPTNTKFSGFFMNAYGNRKEDEKYRNLAEETIAKMMLAEMAEKGTIKIKKLTIVDGKVGGVTTHSAAHGETLDLGDVTVTVEDLGPSDKLDTIFDCGVMVIDEIDNQLKPRSRPMPPGGKSGGADKPIKIPNYNPNNIAEALGEAMSPGVGHTIDDKTLKEGLKKRGYGELSEDLKIGETPAHTMETIREAAATEAAKERSRIGAAYPGSHIENYYKEVVKPSRGYTITWDRRVKEFLTGTGPIMSRSIDEPGIINFIDAEDMGMTEDDRVYMAGVLPQKPEDIMIMMFDTSASVDRIRLGMYISVGISARQSADDMAPEIMLVGADTFMRGNPQDLDDETLLDIMENGYNFNGRGGTDPTLPWKQLMKWAEENNKTIAGIIYATDLGLAPISPEDLPENMPPLMVVAIPADYEASQTVVQNLRDIAEVVVIEPTMHLDFTLAEDRSENRGSPRPS